MLFENQNEKGQIKTRKDKLLCKGFWLCIHFDALYNNDNDNNNDDDDNDDE